MGTFWANFVKNTKYLMGGAKKLAHFLYALTSYALTWPIFKLISQSESGEHL